MCDKLQLHCMLEQLYNTLSHVLSHELCFAHFVVLIICVLMFLFALMAVIVAYRMIHEVSQTTSVHPKS